MPFARQKTPRHRTDPRMGCRRGARLAYERMLAQARVAKFFQAMGPGCQARINRVLATFAQLRIAGVRRAEDRLERYWATEDF